MKKFSVSKIILIASFILLSFVIASCAKNDETKMAIAAQQVEKTSESQTANAKSATATEVKQEEKLMALDFTLQMTDGGTFTLLNSIDKPILVNYWATWCPPCVREFPDLEEMYTTYKDKMHFVAINSAETKAEIDAFMNKNKFTIPVAMDSDNRVGMMYGISSIPTTFIVDVDGSIVFAQLGMMSKAQMKQAIEKTLGN